MTGLRDPGLQPERTELAWRRTALALALGSLIGMRVLPAVFSSALWAIPGVVGVIAAALLWIGARRRYSPVYRAADGEGIVLLDGRLLLLVAIICVVTAAIAAILVWGRFAAP